MGRVIENPPDSKPMIVIAEPYARYQETLAESELELASTRLLEVAEDLCRLHFAARYKAFGITIEARVEVGSTRTWVTISALVGALLFYGNLRQSIDYLIKDADMVSRLIQPKVASTIGLQSSSPKRHERRLGVPGELKRLFARVERGEMLADEAASRALYLLRIHDDAYAARELPRLERKLISEFQIAACSRQEGERQMIEMPHVQVRDGDAKKQQERPKRLDMGLPPTQPIRRRRGVVASRDPRTRHVAIRRY
jgi:hypothetical protein